MVALPLTIWHGQCVIDTSGTPIFFALVAGILRMPSAWAGLRHMECAYYSKRTARTLSEPCQSEMRSKSAYRNGQPARFGVLTLVRSECCNRFNLRTEFRSGRFAELVGEPDVLSAWP